MRAPAILHKSKFKKFLADAGGEVIVRQPPPKVTSMTVSDRVFGRPTEAAPDTGYGLEETIQAVWSTPSISLDEQSLPANIAAIGRTERIDLILRCLLEDVLIGQIYEPTIFDTAKDVEVAGSTFRVKATDRTGLPPIGPYILWAALQKVA